MKKIFIKTETGFSYDNAEEMKVHEEKMQKEGWKSQEVPSYVRLYKTYQRHMIDADVISSYQNGLLNISLNQQDRIEFDYKNWKGVNGHRRVEVIGVHFGSSTFHPEPQWLLNALDLDKQERRLFALKDISNIQTLVESLTEE